MTADSPGVVAADPRLYADIAVALGQVIGTGDSAAQIRPGARLEADLGLDSLELTALGRVLFERFGPGVNLPQLLASLDFDGLIELTVAGLAALVSDQLDGRLAEGAAR